MNARSRLISAAGLSMAMLALAGCKSKGDLVLDEGVGVNAVRSACPAVGIPDYTGDVTLFSVPGSTDARAIDVEAAMTNVRTSCNDGAEKVFASVGFDVLARRIDTSSARTVTLPYFVTVMRGGTAVVSKRVGSVTLNFAPGQERAQAHGTGGAYVDRSAATLPEDIRRRITRKRRAGDEDAAVDPLTEPDVKAAVARSTFEVLVGFQLDDKQLAYNATR